MAQKTKKSVKKNVPHVIMHINATFNNTIITATDVEGNTLAWSSGGKVSFKGSRKSTPYAAQLAAKQVVEAVQNMGASRVDILVKGAGSGRESAIKAIAHTGLRVKLIRDMTPLPHNGCRPRKKRRV